MKEDTRSRISANVAGTLDGLFRERVYQSPERTAYKYFERQSGEWQDLSWEEMARQVSRWQQALQGEKLQPGERVGLLLRNGPEWVACEQAALGLGLVVVPLYTDDRPDNIAYIVNDSGCKVLFIQDEKQWRTLKEHKEDMPGVQRFVILHASPAAEDDPAIRLAGDWLPAKPSVLKERGGDPHKLASIIYTSGTTGRPKGVMLSHHNILSISQAAVEMLDIDDTLVLLSFLPLSHTFERTCGYYVPMMAGATVAYARSIQQLADDLQTIKPSALISVPRIFERIYEKLLQQLKKQSRAHQLLFDMAVNIGWQRFEVRQGRRRPGPALLLWPLLNRLVASKIQAKLGGHLRFTISGGAALPTTVAKTFIGLGINIIQGYGMTESSPVLAGNRLHRNDPRSVGMALPGVELKIGENDELLAKSPGIMLGYWNNHRATSEVISPDGWLHTGDKATISEEGFVYITGRIKDILVMSNGEKIPPGDMESAIALDPLFDQALIVGEGRAYLGALVVLNSEEWFPLARDHGLDPFDENSLNNRQLHATLIRHITEALHDFPGYAKVRRVAPLLETWNVENGLMTPTLKIKRQKVLEKYATLVEQMYSD